ncbi:MAG: hypothetical protein LBK99_26540 [Opitutaceae bacterium]|nr:hypothetical protein [Opitutaceae bacterium]
MNTLNRRIRTWPVIGFALFATMQAQAATETITTAFFDETYEKTVNAGDTLIYDTSGSGTTADEGGAIKVYGPNSPDTVPLRITTGAGATVIFENNSAVNFGGAVRSSQGDIVLQNTVFRNNTSTGYDGGAVYVTGNFTLNIDDNRSLSSCNNQAARDGGFLFLSGGDAAKGYTTATFNIGQNSTYAIGDTSNKNADTLYTSYGILKKTGAGRLVINSDAEWGGTATVEAGTLEINADWCFDAYGSMNVKSGATLSGNGAFIVLENLDNRVTIEKGGTLAPGSGVITIPFLTLEGGAFLDIGNDASISVGDLILDDSALTEKITVSLRTPGGELVDYAIFEDLDRMSITSSSVLQDYFEFTNFEGTLSYLGGKILLTGMVIPESSTCALVAGLGAIALAFHRRTKHRKSE